MGSPREAGVRLGPLELLERVGRGAVGEVWRAKHSRHGRLVAVKFLTPEKLSDPWALDALNNELRIASSLHHPGIVQILDHDHLTATDLHFWNAHFRPSTPYLVMEWVENGSLRSRCGQLSWPELYPILQQLLDALACSHSRGVIHRDLKPSNILVREPNRLAPPFTLLTDFGISQALHAAAGTESEIAGTPAYMAPEQLLGRLSEQGPWTDLFALGCTAWALVCGKAPFGAVRDLAALTHAQLALEPPPFRPVHPMPRPFEEWIRGLLAKDIGQRFHRAADAAHALRTLAQECRQQSVPYPPTGQSNPSPPAQHQTLRVPAPDYDCESANDIQWPTPPTAATTAMIFEPPPIAPKPPRDTHRRWMPPPEMNPDLIRRRALPVVGRQVEQNQLWQCLRSAEQHQRLQIAIIEGANGAGCTHLANWLKECAHKAGAATTLESTEPSHGEPETHILQALSRHLRLLEANPEEQTAKVVRQLWYQGPPKEGDTQRLVAALTESHRCLEPSDVLALGHLTESLTRGPGPDRPLILTIHEAQSCERTLHLLENWLSSQIIQRAILIVLVARPRTGVRDIPPSGSLSRIRMHPDTTQIQLLPLTKAAQRKLYRELLGLGAAAAYELQIQSQGYPAFAIELVSQWIEARELIPGPDGLQRSDPLAPLRLWHPREDWQQKVRRLLSDLHPGDLICLEIAATMLPHVRIRPWHQTCALAGHTPSSTLDQVMRQRAIWKGDPKQEPREFSHPMFKQYLLHEAQRKGRLPNHHRSCAHLLSHGHVTGEDYPLHMAHHLLSSGQLSAALPHLRKGAQYLLHQNRVAEAKRLLRQHAAALAICPNIDEWEEIQSDIVRAQINRHQGRLPSSRNLLLWSLRRARAIDNPLLIGRIRLELAELALYQARPLTAWRHAVRCGQQLQRRTDPVLADQHTTVVQRIWSQTRFPILKTHHFAPNHVSNELEMGMRTND